MAPKSKLLTEAELELMSILWKMGEGGVAEIIERLPKGRDLAYTTVSTIVRILEQKSFVKSRKEGRGHLYSPSISKEAYEARSVKHMVENVFEGEPVNLARQLFKPGALKESELEEIRQMLKKLEEEPS